MPAERPVKARVAVIGGGQNCEHEVNTMPGFTEHSQVPKMFAAAGLPYPELLDLLVTDALAGRCRHPR
jgi:D-alanine-D-alanine ligase-like ATP-grasp enzyme